MEIKMSISQLFICVTHLFIYFPYLFLYLVLAEMALHTMIT